jgi:hypothetical protein
MLHVRDEHNIETKLGPEDHDFQNTVLRDNVEIFTHQKEVLLVNKQFTCLLDLSMQLQGKNMQE